MKKILLILLLLLFTTATQAQWILAGSGQTAASGTTYYVSNSGSDANDGLTISTPWKTTYKVNSVNLNNGDYILFKKGETFSDTTLVAQSGVTYSAYGSGYRPQINTSETITGWAYHSSLSSSSIDTFAQNMDYTGTTFIGMHTGWKITTTKTITLTQILFRVSSNHTYKMKGAISDENLNLISNTTSNEITSETAGVNTLTVSSGASLSANSYWIMLDGDTTNYEIPYNSTAGIDSFFYVSGNYISFPQTSITGETRAGKSAMAIGIVGTSATGSLDTIWAGVASDTIYGGRLTNGEWYANFVGSISEVDNYNEVYVTGDSVYSLDTNFIPYMYDGVVGASDITIDSLQFTNNYVNINNSSANVIVKDSYLNNATYDIYNTGTNVDIYHTKLLNSKYGIWNSGSITAWYNYIYHTGLQSGYAINNSGTIDLDHISFWNDDDLINNTSILTVKNSNLKTSNMNIISTNIVTSDYNNYSSSPRFLLNSVLYTTLSSWQTANGDDANSIANNISYTNENSYDLTLTDVSYSTNRGTTTHSSDILHIAVPQKDTADIGAYESDYYKYGGGTTVTPTSGYYVDNVNGSSSNPGTSTDSAWASMNDVSQYNDTYGFNPSDSIHFKKDQTFVGTMDITSSGIDGNRIVIDSYGSGSDPILTNRQEMPNWKTSTWTKVHGDTVWSIPYNSVSYIGRMWLDGVEYLPAAGSSSSDDNQDGTPNGLNSLHRFFDKTSANIVYLYTTGANPTVEYTTLEIPGVDMWTIGVSGDYITFEHLKIEGGGYGSLGYKGADSLIIQNCEVSKWASTTGIGYNTTLSTTDSIANDMVIRNDSIDSGIRDLIDGIEHDNATAYGISIDGVSGVNIYDNGFRNWKFGVLTVSNNHHVAHVYIHDNYFYAPDISYGKPWQVGSSGDKQKQYWIYIYRNHMKKQRIQNQISKTNDTYVFYNIRDTSEVSLNSHTTLTDQYGLQIVGGGSTIANADSIYYFNNTMNYIVGEGLDEETWSGNNYFYNNLILNSDYGRAATIGMQMKQNNSNKEFKNNLIFFDGMSYGDLIISYNEDPYGATTINIATFNTKFNNSGNMAYEGLISEIINTDYSYPSSSPALNNATAFNEGMKNAMIHVATRDGMITGFRRLDGTLILKYDGTIMNSDLGAGSIK